MFDMEKARQRVREVVQSIAHKKVQDPQPLISSGLIDSLSILHLVSAVETELNIVIPKDRVQPEDFDSVDVILRTIERVASADESKC